MTDNLLEHMVLTFDGACEVREPVGPGEFDRQIELAVAGHSETKREILEFWRYFEAALQVEHAMVLADCIELLHHDVTLHVDADGQLSVLDDPTLSSMTMPWETVRFEYRSWLIDEHAAWLAERTRWLDFTAEVTTF